MSQSPRTGSANPFKKGFTLIELLVVISIIALLSAILFPVFSRARENARRTSCLSNLRQLGMACMQYVQDFDERLPYAVAANGGEVPGGNWAGTDSVTGRENWAWQQILYPYHKSFQVFVCPNTPRVYADKPIQMNYGASTLTNPQPTSSSPPPKLSAFNAASRTYMFLDSGTYSITPTRVRTPNGGFSYVPGTAAITGIAANASPPFTTNLNAQAVADYEKGRHFGGVNITFADGHVKWTKPDSIVEEADKYVNSTIAGQPSSAWNPSNS